MVEGWHVTTIKPCRKVESIVGWMAVLAENGLGPKLSAVSGRQVQTRWHHSLRQWLVPAGPAEVAVMAKRLLGAIWRSGGR